MWAAANDGYERRRHRESSKRRRATDGIARGEEDDVNNNKGAVNYDSSSDSDSSGISSDGERSTTESVHDDDDDDDDPSSSSIGGNNLASSAHSSAAVGTGTGGTSSQTEEAAAAKQKQRRKRKRSKKKRKQKPIIREETPEATMARLKSSYSAAMTAVGALHRVSKQYCDHLKKLKGKQGEKKKTSDDQVGIVKEGNGVDANNNVEGSNDTAMQKDGADNIDTTMETEKSNDTSNEQTTALDNAPKDGDKRTTHREAYNTIQRVAQASRTALEQSLLLDHFILAPILLPDKLKKTNNSLLLGGNDANMEEMSSAWLDVWNHHTKSPSTAVLNANAAAPKSSTGNSAAILCQLSLSKWNKLSAAHRTVIKQISYLALVNYADLLLCGYARREIDGGGVLDRGAVSRLDVLELFTTLLSEGPAEEGEEKSDDTHADSNPSPPTNDQHSTTACLWTNESTERTIRLALAAYCDASELDSTDPTLWFKLACAARALGWEIDRQSSSSLSSSSPSSSVAGGPPSRSSYRCLERLALERGLSSLPPGVPPNRLLMRAWREMQSWDRRSSTIGNISQVSSEDAEDIPVEKKSPVELVIHLPRYSWATLGRILIRACREGVSYGRALPDGSLHHGWSTNCNSPEDFDFGSPLVDVIIPPLLAIPHCVLGKICEYLEESTDIKRLTCACRAMSSELASAMAEMTEAKKRSTVASETGRCDEPKDNGTADDSTGGSGPEDISRDNGKSSAPIDIDNQHDADLTPPRRGRVSKRVRSQLLESVKESERKSKRSNVQYCLLAGTLSCTAQHPYYKKLLKTDFDWEQLPLVRKCIQMLPTEDDGLSSAVATKPMSQMDRTFAFLAPASLNEFVHRLSGNNSGPRDFLEHFLLHISLNVGDVFWTETTESLALCALDCFDAMVACSKRNMEVTPWYGPESYEDSNGNIGLALQTLAVNLLNAELRLKRCESHDIGSHDHEEDSDVLAYMVPNLLQCATMITQAITQTEGSNNANKNILQLQCRSFWLASLYYTWISRYTNDASVSKEAEDLGLQYLDKAMSCLSESSDTLIIKTPHLASSDRPGDHSKLSDKSLSKYREHLQSSSVVSRARQCFQEIQRLVDERSQSKVNGADVITAEEKGKLGSLGIELLERYAVGEKASDAIQELLEDFLLLHSDNLHITDASAQPQWAGEAQWGNIWTDIPSSRASSFVNLSKVQGSRPSVLQVLAASLLASEEKIASVFLIFDKVVSTALLLRAQTIQKENSDGTRADYEDTVENADVATTGTSRRFQLLSLVVIFFTDKMTDMIASYASEPEMSDALDSFLVGEDLNNIIILSLQMTPNNQKDLAENSEVPRHQFESVSRLVMQLRGCQGLSRNAQEKVESAYFIALVRALIHLRLDFAKQTSSVNDKRLKTWQSHITCNIRLICFILNELAELLSLNLSTVSAGGSVDISHLIKAIIGQDEEGQQMADTCPLAQLTEALLFLYKFDGTSPAEREARSRLTIPVSCAIISLCGSLGVSVEQSFSNIFGRADEKGANTAYSDYFDSEDSVNGIFLPCGSEEEKDLRCRRILLRKICQLVQCVSLVFQSVDDKMISQDGSPPIHYPSSQHGPFLPLVVARVASSMSDAIFQLFEEDVWNDSYPFGAREVGKSIDISLLGRAYMLLFGFSFSGADSDMTKNRAPESIDAATSVFRCIKRVYHDNRKSPPDKAYETVELALPAAEESKVSKAIKAFLFDASKDVEAIHNTTEVPPGFPAWVLSESNSTDITGGDDQANIERLRRGIAASLAKGQITHLDSDRNSPSDTDDEKGLSGERGTSQSHELSLDRKFRAVLDDLCYNPNNSERWIVLNETLSFKADQMCDKLAPIKDDCFEPSDYILCPESKRQEPATNSLEQVHKSQAEELGSTRQDWTPFIGDNLSVYMQYPWSSLTSLQACAQDIGCKLNENSPDYMCWRNIESKFEEGDIDSWARSWAGMFVMALRSMRMKALFVARYVAKKSQDGMHPSEVSEDVGTALYGDLMASTVYGYPMHYMTPYEKRRIAERSNFYFQEAIQLSISSDYAQKSQTVAWEVEFMIGKSYEKVASTLREEMYSLNSTDGDQRARLYETIMIDAIKNYSKSCAGEMEQSRGGTGETGGSSHGYLECLYRLHATRLKVLVAAIRRAPEECELAELEAFRIASTTWFDQSNQPATSDIRGKIWSLFADCVDALSHCRNEAPLFHRAAYRLAQAFNFAPAFHNPDCDLSTGSNQTVPAIKSYKIRGLGSGSCAESAQEQIKKLFDKKRTQLCAVWVTTSAAPPPFEVLNDSVRKYDAIRLKYIRAYIESMQECGLKDKIEALLNWTASSGQDLASFYSASATLKGGDPGKHSKQSLLVGPEKGFIPSVKHHSIRALAEMILKDLAALKKNGVGNEGKLKLTKLFKLASSLFLRLNAPCNAVAEYRQSSNKLDIVDAFCRCYLSIQSGYRISSIQFDEMESTTLCSILEGAKSKAKTLAQEAKATSKKEKTKD